MACGRFTGHPGYPASHGRSGHLTTAEVASPAAAAAAASVSAMEEKVGATTQTTLSSHPEKGIVKRIEGSTVGEAQQKQRR